MQSKDIITVVAKYWANSSQEEKQVSLQFLLAILVFMGTATSVVVNFIGLDFNLSVVMLFPLQVWKERAEALKEANEDAGSLLGEDITEKAIDAAEELVEDKVTTPKKKSAKRVITKVEVQCSVFFKGTKPNIKLVASLVQLLPCDEFLLIHYFLAVLVHNTTSSRCAQLVLIEYSISVIIMMPPWSSLVWYIDCIPFHHCLATVMDNTRQLRKTLAPFKHKFQISQSPLCTRSY